MILVRRETKQKLLKEDTLLPAFCSYRLKYRSRDCMQGNCVADLTSVMQVVFREKKRKERRPVHIKYL